MGSSAMEDVRRKHADGISDDIESSHQSYGARKGGTGYGTGGGRDTFYQRDVKLHEKQRIWRGCCSC